MEFLREGDNVLLRGQSGVGKTTLAKNLGHLALAKGHKVRFTTLSDLLVDLHAGGADYEFARITGFPDVRGPSRDRSQRSAAVFEIGRAHV